MDEIVAERLLEQLDLIELTPKTILVFGAPFELISEQLITRYPQAEIIQAPTQSVDLIIDNLTLHTHADLDAVLIQRHKNLNPTGLFLFSTLGPDTLQEVPEQQNPHFIDMHHVGDKLIAARFIDPVLSMEKITLQYRQPHKMPPTVTYEVIYGQAWGNPQQNFPTGITGETAIPLSQLGKRGKN